MIFLKIFWEFGLSNSDQPEPTCICRRLRVISMLEALLYVLSDFKARKLKTVTVDGRHAGER